MGDPLDSFCEHRHSGIRYVSPAQRHAGEDQAILAARQALFASARDLTPHVGQGKHETGRRSVL